MKARITYATSTLIVVLFVLVSACSENTLVQDPTSPAAEQAIAAAKNDSRVAICHFPPGYPDDPQVITVDANAAEAHIANHDGDGVVGEEYDENCQPIAVACPCWEESSIAAQDWTREKDNWTDGSKGDFYHLLSQSEIVAVAHVDDGYVCDSKVKRTVLDPIEQPAGVEEAQACVDLLRAYAP